MITAEPTPAMIARWKSIYERRHSQMHPNRKSGADVDGYFREHYNYRPADSEKFRQMVAEEITENDFLREKLPEGVKPDVRCYTVGDVLVGIDVAGGAFHVESEDMAQASAIYDDLFVFRGLDETDLTNFFLVAEYITLTEKTAGI